MKSVAWILKRCVWKQPKAEISLERVAFALWFSLIKADNQANMQLDKTNQVKSVVFENTRGAI